MFDAGSGGSDIGTFDSGDDRSPERRQYTLKGVEADTIRLMRYAASKEGMKIGSWVSVRMREAAERALSKDPQDRETTYERQAVGAAPVSEDALSSLVDFIKAQQQATERRFAVLEKELHEITSGQRTILSALIAEKLR